MINTINIEGIRVYAFHGCNDDEARTGGSYLIDIYIDTDFSEAIASDQLDKTVDYCAVYEVCKAEMAVRSNLIEEAGHRIFRRLKETFTGIINLRIRLTKLTPPISGDVDRVSIEIGD